MKKHMLKRIYYLGVFLIVACLSFFITKKLREYNSIKNTSSESTVIEAPITDPSVDTQSTTSVSGAGGTGGVTQPGTTNTVNSGTTGESNKITINASKPILENDLYSFYASFSGKVTDTYHFELWSNHLVSQSKDGRFSNIPAIKSGSYKLCLVSDVTGKNIVPPITVRGFYLKRDEPTPPTEPNNNPSIGKKEIVLKASKPSYKNNKYSFKASYVGDISESCRYELWGDKLIQSSNDGFFSNVPPIGGGKYKLNLVSETDNRIIASINVPGFVDNQKKLITVEEFQKRMLDRKDRTLDGGKKSFVTKSFRVVVVNSNPQIDGEHEVTDIQDVREMIYIVDKWKGASVTELEYDAQGYVTVAKIAAEY